jgi:hypothetical protein
MQVFTSDGGHEGQMLAEFLTAHSQPILAQAVLDAHYVEYDGPDSYDRWAGDAYSIARTVVAKALGIPDDGWVAYAAEAWLVAAGLRPDRPHSHDLARGKYILAQSA